MKLRSAVDGTKLTLAVRLRFYNVLGAQLDVILSWLEGRNNGNVDMPQVSHIVIVSLLLHRCWVDIVVTEVSSGCLDQEGLTLGIALTFTLNV